jgi:parallel beta-helix repeat protein
LSARPSVFARLVCAALLLSQTAASFATRVAAEPEAVVSAETVDDDAGQLTAPDPEFLQVAGVTTQPITIQPIRTAPQSCRFTIQQLVDAAAPGATVSVPPCVYRETVTITKPVTLVGGPGVEIRGSDVWADWLQNGSFWVKGTLPTFAAHGTCVSGTSRCLWPEQVFFDGKPLVQVAANPISGQFAVNPSRQVVLADNPGGHMVEVTTRTNWVVIRSNNVTIQNFTMKHAANDSQSGALTANGYSGLTVKDSVLSDAHGDTLSFLYGSNHQITGNEIFHAGQTGMGAYKSTDVLVQNNRIHDNNTEGFDPNWEAGGLKMASVARVTLDGNEVYANVGPGLWCDISCQAITYSHNTVHDNTEAGIFFEISSGATIASNALWNNGSASAAGWGCDIFVSSSSDADVYGNTILATRTHAILVVSQNRAGYTSVVNNSVHDNTVVMSQLYSGVGRTGLGWIQDWTGTLFDAASNNRGLNNAFWFSYPEPSWERFDWAGARDTLAAFSATPGGAGSRMLSVAERDAALAAAGIPAVL